MDTAGAGEGELEVSIMHNGMRVPVQIQNEGRGLYKVNFTPTGSGIYTIKVFFAGMEVTGAQNLSLTSENLVADDVTVIFLFSCQQDRRTHSRSWTHPW